MNVPLRAVAEGRAEMAFWPVIAALFVYGATHHWVDLLLVGVFTVAAGQTYILLRNVSAAVEEQKGRQTTRSRNSRAGVTPGPDLTGTATEAVLELIPGGTRTMTFIGGSVLLEGVGGLFIWYRLWDISQPLTAASVATLGVLMLPVLYISTLGARVLWSHSG